MSPTSEAEHAARTETVAPPADRASSEQLVEALAEYHGAMDAGQPPSREDFLNRYPEIAKELDGYLDGFEFVRQVAPQLRTPDDEAHSEPVLTERATLGDFQILSEIGRGGMGVVYEAEQLSIGRRVALKVLPFAAMLDRQQLNRFKNEARAAGTLDHPNIVAIHSVGCERGVHYYAMQLIEGQSLAEVVEQLRAGDCPDFAESTEQNGTVPLTHSPDTEAIAHAPTLHAPSSQLPAYASRDYFRTVAQLGIQAAEALDHAHQNGVLHRDIKPANLLVECNHLAPRDETAKLHHAERDGYTLKLWITDFGLARMEQDAGMTMTGDILGTLRYMSPEQALAKRAVIDHRSDIYSLGITLYELLTRQPAFTGDDRQELLHQIVFEEPRNPRQINPGIPQDLETIILKSIEKDPSDRYPTAQDLAEDLRAFLENRPVRARQASLAHRTRKLLRRHRPVVVATVVTLLVAVAIGVLGLIFTLGRERGLRQTAQQHLALARKSVDEMLTKVASTWVADTTATSEIQRQFLEQALAIYQQLARNPLDGNPRGSDTAVAYERIAGIQQHLGGFSEATDSIRSAVKICHELAAQNPAGVANSEQLARCYRKLATLLREQSQLAEALDATRLGIEHTRPLVDRKTALPSLRWELGHLLYEHASLLVAANRLDEAAITIKQAHAIVKGHFSEPGISVDDLMLYPQFTDLETTVLHRQGRLVEAEDTARPALGALFRVRSNYADAKRFLEVQADLGETLAEVLLAQGESEKAVDQLRQALSVRRERLGGRNPSQLYFAVFFEQKQPISWRYVEPLAIADYCQTQLRLAAALSGAGRPYEAQCMLGESLINAQIVNDSRGDILRFWVLHANAAAAVGEHLTARDSPEAPHYLQLAAALWNEMQLQFPRAIEFQSGTHGPMRDWDWFRASYLDYASQKGTRESLKLNSRDTAFWQHVLGHEQFQNEAWDSAVNHFTKSANLRTTGQAYDWLHMAIAYQKLGQPEKAKTEYDRAFAQIQAPDAELESLRDTAARLIEEDKTTNSN
jgi:serine/threonine protein kinase/tetratricopeptide (TPR) repeat protein